MIGELIWMKKMFKKTKINKNCFYKKNKTNLCLIGKKNVIKSTETKIRVKNLSLVSTVDLVHQKLKSQKFKAKFLRWKNKRSQRKNCGRELKYNVRNAEINLLWWLRIKTKKEKRTSKLIYKMIDSRQFMKTHFSQSILQILNSIIEEQETYSNKSYKEIKIKIRNENVLFCFIYFCII